MQSLLGVENLTDKNAEDPQTCNTLLFDSRMAVVILETFSSLSCFLLCIRCKPQAATTLSDPLRHTLQNLGGETLGVAQQQRASERTVLNVTILYITSPPVEGRRIARLSKQCPSSPYR